VRNLTPAMIAALSGQQTDEVFVILLTFGRILRTTNAYEVLARFSTDPTVRHSLTPLLYKTVSNGQDFFYIPMSISLPNDTDGSPTTAQLQIANVGLELIDMLRTIDADTYNYTVDLDVVVASDPNTIGYAVPTLDLVQADWDENTVTLSLTIEALDREPYPSGNFTPKGFPALF